MSDKTPSLLSTEQRLATRVDASVWVGASAGTGKTHMLTARVLRLMLTGTPPDKILCVTFTKAAAAEMANRITDELGEWVRLDDRALDAKIHARVDEKADAAMRHRARSLFAQVLDLPGGLRIKTIHAFCQSMLARFPVEAGLPPHFQVLDERSAQEALRDATEQSIAAAGDDMDGPLGQAVRTIAVRASEGTFADLMKTLAHERGQLARLMMKFRTVDNLNAAIARCLNIERDDTLDGLTHHAATDCHMNESALAKLGELADEGSPTDQIKGATLRAFLAAKDAERIALFPDYENIFLKKDYDIRAAILTKKVLPESHPLYSAAQDEALRLQKFNEKRRALDVLDKTAALMHLAFDVLGRYQARKSQMSALDYDDLIQKTDALLERPGIAPWVLYKMDGGLDHILIDEAQDTNPEQWRIVEALSEDFYTGESARKRIGTVLAVGDVKQSIYSFQRADPASFKQAENRVMSRATAAGLHFESVAMDRSYRSTSAVLNMVDACFDDESATHSLTLGTEPISHSVARIGMAGHVELWPKEPVAKKPDPEDWVLPLKQEREVSAPARLAARIADQMANMINDHMPLAARDRAVTAGDIMVLVPRRTAFVDHLIRELKHRKIPVMGSDRMKLGEQLAVMDLVSLARFVLLTDDHLSLAEVLKSPLIGLSEEALYDLAHNRKGGLWQSLHARKDEAAFQSAYAFLDDALSRADFDAPYEFFSAILTNGGRKLILARLGKEANDPLDEFLSLAVQYEMSHTPSLQGFLHWLSSGSAEIKRDMETGTGEVRIMTIHGAKGLQAPVVFLPDTTKAPDARFNTLSITDDLTGESLMLWPNDKTQDFGPLGFSRDLRIARMEDEYLRQLYVALTRAEDRLIVCGWEMERESKTIMSWYDRIKSSMEAMDGITRCDMGDGREALYLSHSQSVPPKVDTPNQSRGGSDVPLPSWLRRPPPAEDMPPKPLSPSKLDEGAPAARSPLVAVTKDAVKRGTAIHTLLERLPGLPVNTRRDTALRYLQRPSLSFKKDQMDDILASVMRVLEDPTFAPLFGPNSKAEVTLSGVVGARVVSGQVDRLLVADDHILVVDYKSNRVPPANAKDAPEAYLKQMAAYVAVLEKIYPNHPIKAALLWTETAQLMPLERDQIAPYMNPKI